MRGRNPRSTLGTLGIPGILGLFLVAGSSREASAAPPRRTPPPPTPTATPVETPGEHVYRLGREALGRGAFELAAKLFTALDGENRWERDPAYAFNRAQALRYSSRPGEAVYWYGRYLTLAPAAPDTERVTEQAHKLMSSSPAAVRAAAYRRLSEEWVQRLAGEPELARALDEMPIVNLLVRFRRRVSEGPEPTWYAFPGRALFWKSPADETPSATWKVWVVATSPILAPEGLGAPPLLGLPPGRPFPVSIGADLVSSPVLRPGEPLLGYPADADVAAWQLEVMAEVRGMGPPVYLVSASGSQAVEVRSGPRDPGLVLGKRRDGVPVIATPLAFGPRVARADGKLYPGVLMAVFDRTETGGEVTRWAATLASVDVVNRFGRLVEKPGEPARLLVRNEETGPGLSSLP